MIKTQIQIRTGDFEYIMQEVEVIGATGAVEAFNELKDTFKASQTAPEGLQTKEFDRVLDKYLSGGGMDAEAYGKMSKIQVELVQTVKRSLARIKRRNQTQESEDNYYGGPGKGENGDYSNMD